MPLRRARSDSHAGRRIGNGSASGDEGSEDVNLTGRRRPRERPSQVSISQAGLTWLRTDPGQEGEHELGSARRVAGHVTAWTYPVGHSAVDLVQTSAPSWS